MRSRPLAIDLFCGLGGWAEGLLAEGYDVVGFDIERHEYGEHRYPGQLVIQDVRTLHGSQFKDAALIVASPPCQEYSYRAMPWKRAKALPPPDNTLFETCFPHPARGLRGGWPAYPDGRRECAWRPEVGRAGALEFRELLSLGRRAGADAADAQGGEGSEAELAGPTARLVRGPSIDRRAASRRARWRKNDGGSWFNIARDTTSGKGKPSRKSTRRIQRNHPALGTLREHLPRYQGAQDGERNDCQDPAAAQPSYRALLSAIPASEAA